MSVTYYYVKHTRTKIRKDVYRRQPPPRYFNDIFKYPLLSLISFFLSFFKFKQSMQLTRCYLRVQTRRINRVRDFHDGAEKGGGSVGDE